MSITKCAFRPALRRPLLCGSVVPFNCSIAIAALSSSTTVLGLMLAPPAPRSTGLSSGARNARSNAPMREVGTAQTVRHSQRRSSRP